MERQFKLSSSQPQTYVQRQTASISVESDVDTLHLQVIRLSIDNTKSIIPVSLQIRHSGKIMINRYHAHALTDNCTINSDLISGNFCFLNKIPTEEVNTKHLETAIKANRSTMTTKATGELNIQGHESSRTFNISNLRDCDAILGKLFPVVQNVCMDVRNNQVSIQSTGKLRQQVHILQKHSRVGSTIAYSIYDYDDNISNY